MKKQTFEITGMTCSACSSRVEKTVSRLPGIKKASVNLLTNSMMTEFDEAVVDIPDIVAAVKRAGYGIAAAGSTAKNRLDNRGNRGGATQNAGARGSFRGAASSMSTATIAARTEESQAAKTEAASLVDQELTHMRFRLIVSFAFLIPLMYVSMGHMMGLPLPGLLTGMENAVAYGLTQLLLCLPILYVNQNYFRMGFKTLFHGAPNMDSLIAIGASAALIYGVFAIYRMGYGLGHGDMHLVMTYHMDLYFESAATILTLITLGKYLETRSRGRTSEAITKLINLAPKTALVERDGRTQEVPAEQVQIEDVVWVKPGSAIPVDGIILEGHTSLDEAAITGESLPVEKNPGDAVMAAAINKSGFIKFRATKVGNDTTLAQIIRLVEEASASKAPIAKLADKISGIFVPIVMAIALITVVAWLITGAAFEFAMSAGIAVLVISCPCALGLATPVAIMVGTGKGAEHGILIKSGEALETAHNISTVVLDKTGTITEGKPAVTDVLTADCTREQLMTIALGLEKQSEHPLAEAIVAAAEEEGLTAPEVSKFQAVFGRGVTAEIDGDVYFAGNAAYMDDQKIDLTEWNSHIDQLAAQGKTPLLFASSSALLGIIAVADTIKPTSKDAIDAFRHLGVNVVMLTGDNKRTAEAIRGQLSIPTVIAEVLPQDKEKEVSRLQQEGQVVAMVGDGINDAPALARADVGIAIGAGTDVAIESADIVLMKSDLLDAVTAIRLSKAVIRNIRQNLFWAFFYNSVGIPLAAGVFYTFLGWKLNPMFAAAAMSLSSVCVVANALRLKLFR